MINMYAVTNLRYVPPGDLYSIWIIAAKDPANAVALAGVGMTVDLKLLGVAYTDEMVISKKDIESPFEPRVREEVVTETYHPLMDGYSQARYHALLAKIESLANRKLGLGSSVAVDKIYIHSSRPEVMLDISGDQFGSSRAFYPLSEKGAAEMRDVDNSPFEFDLTKSIEVKRRVMVPLDLSWRSRLSRYVQAANRDKSVAEQLALYWMLAFKLIRDAQEIDLTETITPDPCLPDFTMVVPGGDDTMIHQVLDRMGIPRKVDAAH
ncbi:hypothetical protein AH06_63 [Erwinia phage AH06]|nr:hypothetical protein AH06_63 [Erwinia phage AH06]